MGAKEAALEYAIPPGNPWREVTHEGDVYLVRECDGATWINRVRDRATWFHDIGQAVPTWARSDLLAAPQRELFS